LEWLLQAPQQPFQAYFPDDNIWIWKITFFRDSSTLILILFSFLPHSATYQWFLALARPPFRVEIECKMLGLTVENVLERNK
jgi:hypothetical protein